MWARKEHSDHTTEPDSQNFTLLAKDVDFKGVVNFDGTVRVDGRVEGEIHTTGTLIVGENAIIKGIVSAGVLMNSGKINGTITANGRGKKILVFKFKRKKQYKRTIGHRQDYTEVRFGDLVS